MNWTVLVVAMALQPQAQLEMKAGKQYATEVQCQVAVALARVALNNMEHKVNKVEMVCVPTSEIAALVKSKISGGVK